MIPVRLIISDGFKLLTPKERKRVRLLVPLFVLAGFVEMAALGSVAPLAALLVAPDSLDKMPWVAELFAKFGLTDTRDILIGLSLGVIGFLIGAAGFSIIVQHLFRTFCSHFGSRLSHDVYRQVLSAPYTFILRRNAARLAAEIQTDIGNTTNMFVPALFASFYAMSIVFFGVFLIIGFSSWPAFVGIAVIGFCAFLAHRTTRSIIRSLAVVGRIATQDGASLGTQAFVGAKNIKIKRAEARFAESLAEAFSRLTSARQKQIFIQQLIPVVFMVIGQLGLIGVVVWMLIDGATYAQVANQVAILLLVLSRMVPAMNRLIGAAQNIQKAEPHVTALRKLIADVAAEDKGPGPATHIPDDWNELVLRNVSFAYAEGEDAALYGINISLKRGVCYGIVGPSGAGKSTLVDILLGLLSPDSGAIEIDGTPTDLSGESWHRRVGYVPQNTFILDDTVRRNVAFTSTDRGVDDARVRSSLAAAGLNSIRGDREIDLETQLGDHGNQLSGGQSQRIAIARALYARPEIVVFDEATSGLDKSTEDKVLSTIQALPGTLTRLIISHDPVLIARCDEVIYLKSGRVESQGAIGTSDGEHVYAAPCGTHRFHL